MGRSSAASFEERLSMKTPDLRSTQGMCNDH
jgi:hypothetical protein